MFRLMVLGLFAAILLAFGRPNGLEAGTLDQQFTGTGNTTGLVGMPSSSGLWDWAQTFTAGITGNLDRVDINVYKGGAFDTSQATQGLTVTIRSTSGGVPTSTVLGTVSLTVAQVPGTESSPSFVAVTISPPIHVVSGSQYAIALSYPFDASTGAGFYTWVGSDQNATSYAGGRVYSAPTGGAFVVPNPCCYTTADVDFKTYVVAGGTPLTGIGVFRNANWYLNSQADGSAPEFYFYYGVGTDVAVTGDWNCSGTKSPGLFRNGAWYLTDFKNGTGPNYSFFFGAAGDIPVVGDWDGNGCDSVGVFRNGLWYLTNAITGSPTVNYSFFYGATGDKPVTGDWDGNHSTSVGIFRGGAWYLTNAISGSPVPNYTFSYGVGTDVPIAGDWDGNGATSVGIFRSGTFYLTNAITGSPVPNLSFNFGVASDKPLAGSWGATVSDVRAAQQASTASACTATFSCQPGPNDWYGAKSLADPKAGAPLGWTGLAAPPSPGWTGIGEAPPPPGWTGLTSGPPLLPASPPPSPTPTPSATPATGPGTGPGSPGSKGGTVGAKADAGRPK